MHDSNYLIETIIVYILNYYSVCSSVITIIIIRYQVVSLIKYIKAGVCYKYHLHITVAHYISHYRWFTETIMTVVPP